MATCNCEELLKMGALVDLCPLHKAAPMLLEACEAAIKALDTFSENWPDFYTFLDAERKVKAAIRAAKGGE